MSTAASESPRERSPLDEAEVAKLWQAFGVFDADKSGSISVAELGAVMRSLGQDAPEDQLRALIDEVDVDRSGTIDFDEF